MRSRSENGFFSVHAFAGTHVVVFGLDVKGYEDRSTPSSTDSTEGLAGALSRIALGDGVVADEGRKRVSSSDAKAAPNSGVVFAGFAIDRVEGDSSRAISLNSNGMPIQKFLWCDNTALPGRK